MKKLIFFFVVLFIAFSAQCSAQQVRVVTPNGDTAAYVPQLTKIILKHDTTIISVMVHDTVFIAEKETIVQTLERDIEPVFMNIPISLVHDTVLVPENRKPQFGFFGEADFHSAIIAPSLKLYLNSFDFWVFIGSYYNANTHNSYFTAGAAGFVQF